MKDLSGAPLQAFDKVRSCVVQETREEWDWGPYVEEGRASEQELGSRRLEMINIKREFFNYYFTLCGGTASCDL